MSIKQQTNKQAIKTTPEGLKYFEELPEGFRPARASDFFDNGRFIVNLPYLVLSTWSNVFYAERTTDLNEDLVNTLMEYDVYVYDKEKV